MTHYVCEEIFEAVCLFEFFCINFQCLLSPLALCDVFNGKEDNLYTDHFLIDLTGIEKHYFLTDSLERMRDFVVKELCVFRKDLLKQRPKRRDIQLSVSN